jgi:hypothetical protein
MTPEELMAKLDEMILLPSEEEWLEFKEAKNDFPFDDLGKYFSGLSNEANLNKKQAGWLIFGVTDKPPRQICGSNYRKYVPGLEKLKKEIAQHTNNQITFIDIHELMDVRGRIVLFEIPPAPRGIPTSWKGHFYGRIYESLSPLSPSEYDRIRGQDISNLFKHDWLEDEMKFIAKMNSSIGNPFIRRLFTQAKDGLKAKQEHDSFWKYVRQNMHRTRDPDLQMKLEDCINVMDTFQSEQKGIPKLRQDELWHEFDIYSENLPKLVKARYEYLKQEIRKMEEDKN